MISREGPMTKDELARRIDPESTRSSLRALLRNGDLRLMKSRYEIRTG